MPQAATLARRPGAPRRYTDAMGSHDVLDAHAAVHSRIWRVADVAVPLVSAVALRGYPDLDPALDALGEALARGRLAPPRAPFLDATGGAGAVLAYARALAGAADTLPGQVLMTSAAARRAVTALGVPADAQRADHAWDLPAASVAEAWWRPPLERGWVRALAELDGWARALSPTGRLVAVWHKDEGGRRAERAAAERFDGLEVVNRAGGWRVVVLSGPRPPAGTLDPWRAWDGPDGAMRTLAGTFAGDRLDAGTAALLQALEAAGSDVVAGARVLDLGCGSGVLSCRALRLGARDVLAVDDDLAAVRSSAAVLAGERARVLWSDLTLDAPDALDMDVVLTNPPFHVGRRVVGALSEGFVAAAERALRPGGTLWLVANAALPFGRLLAPWRDVRDVTPTAVRGYRVFRAERP